MVTRYSLIFGLPTMTVNSTLYSPRASGSTCSAALSRAVLRSMPLPFLGPFMTTPRLGGIATLLRRGNTDNGTGVAKNQLTVEEAPFLPARCEAVSEACRETLLEERHHAEFAGQQGVVPSEGVGRTPETRGPVEAPEARTDRCQAKQA